MAFVSQLTGYWLLLIYGNIIDNPVWIVGASLFIILVSTLFCLMMPSKQNSLEKK